MSRILFLSHSPELNGSELWLLETLRGLDRARFEPLGVAGILSKQKFVEAELRQLIDQCLKRTA